MRTADVLMQMQVAILNTGSIAGRLIPNALADIFGRFNVICPIAFVSTILLFSMFGVKSVAAVTVFALLYGFFSGASAFTSFIPSTDRAHDPHDLSCVSVSPARRCNGAPPIGGGVRTSLYVRRSHN